MGLSLSDNVVRFPSVVIQSVAEFRRFRTENSDLLDERYRLEQSFGSKEHHIILKGTCALCLLVTRFTSATTGGTTTEDGLMVPNWREGQVCGCRHGLNSRQRALLHLALSRFGSPAWSRAAILGREDRVAQYLLPLMKHLSIWPNFAQTNGGPSLPGETASAHLLVSAEHLHNVPNWHDALQEIARVLAPGGCFVFTVPFHIHLEVTQTCIIHPLVESRVLTGLPGHPAHQIGWDILDRLQEAGFTDSTAHCYWSQEFGYLGTFNMVFRAFR